MQFAPTAEQQRFNGSNNRFRLGPVDHTLMSALCFSKLWTLEGNTDGGFFGVAGVIEPGEIAQWDAAILSFPGDCSFTFWAMSMGCVSIPAVFRALAMQSPVPEDIILEFAHNAIGIKAAALNDAKRARR